VTDPRVRPQHSIVAPANPEGPDFEKVYRDEFAFVFRVLRYLGASGADAEDLAHDVFVVVYRRLASYDPSRPIRPWLFGITYRVVLRHRERLAVRGAPAGDTPDLPAREPPVDRQLEVAEAWAMVAAALGQLPLDQRAVLILHDIEEQTAPEIAAELGVPLNTVYSRLRLARERFAAVLRRSAGGER